MENRIAVRRLGKVLVPAGQARQPDAVVATIGTEMARLGFIPSEALLEALRSLDDDRLAPFSRDLLDALASASGADPVHRAFSPSFPESVVSASETLRYLDAVADYHAARGRRPPSTGGDRPYSAGTSLIGLATREEFEHIFRRLGETTMPLSATYIRDLDWFVREYPDRISSLFPDDIPHRELVAHLAASMWNADPSLGRPFVEHHVTSATDVLRWCVALSDGDATLATTTRFISFSRQVRRLAMDVLEAAPALIDEVAPHPERWKRLGERLHPGEFTATHPRAASCFRAVRSGEPLSFASRLERAFAAGDMATVLDVAAERPEELARGLDRLLRSSPMPDQVLDRFARAAPDVSTPALLQLAAHVEVRGRPVESQPRSRAFLPGGRSAKLWARVEDRPSLPTAVADRAVTLAHDELRRRFAVLDPLGACYVDPLLADYPVPTARPADSRPFRTVARGSRLPLPPGPVVRLFVSWQHGRSNAHIELSASFFDSDFRRIEVEWRSATGAPDAVHRGAIVGGARDAAKFVDLDTGALRERGIRYVAATVSNYGKQPYCDLPECIAGWTGREAIGAAETFDRRTVTEWVDVTSGAMFAIPLVVDLDRAQVVWADLSLRTNPHFVDAVGPNLKGVSMLVEAITTATGPNLLQLFSLHAAARGHLVSTPDDADTVFSTTAGITPFDIDRIRSDFLTSE